VVYADDIKYQRYEWRQSLDQIAIKQKLEESPKALRWQRNKGGEEEYTKHCQLQDDPNYTSNV